MYSRDNVKEFPIMGVNAAKTFEQTSSDTTTTTTATRSAGFQAQVIKTMLYRKPIIFNVKVKYHFRFGESVSENRICELAI